MKYFFSSLVVSALWVAACSSTESGSGAPSGTGGTNETGGMANASGSASGASTGGAAGTVGTGGVAGAQCTTNSECPQLRCQGCSSTCVNGRCVAHVPTGVGGAIGTGGANAGGSASGGRGNGGAGTGGFRGGTGGGGPATCPDHAPRLPQYPYTPERCTLGDMSLSCPYPTPEIGAGCRTTFICRCLSNHMGGADCNWMGSGSVCPDGGP
jgi:hypothetical protein